MGLQKFGDGAILPEDDTKKTAKKDWTEDDAEALRKENEKADSE
jgi:hypothetical protein